MKILLSISIVFLIWYSSSAQTQTKLPISDTNKQVLTLHRLQRSIDIANQLMPLEDRLSKIEAIDSLAKRIQLLENSKHIKLFSWWNRLGDFILSTGSLTALISIIFGLFKWLLASSKFRHERKLSFSEHQNKWRNEYLSKALDSNIELSFRLQFLRFLEGTSKEDTAIANWAKNEINVLQNAQVNQMLYQDKIAELNELQFSFSTTDNQFHEQINTKINKLSSEILEIKNKLIADGFFQMELRTSRPKEEKVQELQPTAAA